MARIAGVDLPKNKHMVIALTYIHGIGKSSSRKILDAVKIDYTMSTDNLDDNQVAEIRKIIESSHSVEGDRRRNVAMDIKRMMDLGSYRGIRHRKGLPCRGQRTSTNARTRRGPRRTANK